MLTRLPDAARGCARAASRAPLTALLASDMTALFDSSTLLGLIGDSIVVALAGRARRLLVGDSKWAAWRERLTGTVLVALGIRLATLKAR